MRTEVFLVLLVTLAFSDGLDNIGISYNQSDFFNFAPCQISFNNNAYNYFMYQHILPNNFDVNNPMNWQGYLSSTGLCGRKPVQSFLSGADITGIVNICNGQGINVRYNTCTSINAFLVYIVQSGWANGVCSVTGIFYNYYYVTVACDKINNYCLPVHYETQSPWPPDIHGVICRP